MSTTRTDHADDGLRGEGAPPSSVTLSPCHPVTLSPGRAWFFLVWLSMQRQARARQMVWIGLVLMGLSVALVAVNTQLDRWGMHHWRHPRRVGPTYPTWVTET